jgi:hypothetical protein
VTEKSESPVFDAKAEPKMPHENAAILSVANKTLLFISLLYYRSPSFLIFDII